MKSLELIKKTVIVTITILVTLFLVGLVISIVTKHTMRIVPVEEQMKSEIRK